MVGNGQIGVYSHDLDKEHQGIVHLIIQLDLLDFVFELTFLELCEGGLHRVVVKPHHINGFALVANDLYLYVYAVLADKDFLHYLDFGLVLARSFIPIESEVFGDGNGVSGHVLLQDGGSFDDFKDEVDVVS